MARAFSASAKECQLQTTTPPAKVAFAFDAQGLSFAENEQVIQPGRFGELLNHCSVHFELGPGHLATNRDRC